MKDNNEFINEKLENKNVYIISNTGDNIIKDITDKSKLTISILEDYISKIKDTNVNIDMNKTPIVVEIPDGYIPVESMKVEVMKDNDKEIPIIVINSNTYHK